MTGYPLNGLRVLLVEDEPLIELQLEGLMSGAGATVAGAGSVAAALELIAENEFDVAVLDVRLGHEDARPIAATLRALDIPYVVASASEPDDLPGEMRRAPYLQKPFDDGMLTAAVREAALVRPAGAAR